MSIRVFLFTLGLASAGVYAQECSNASLTGAFGYTLSGSETNGEGKLVRSSQVGRIVFDGAGKYTGVAAISLGTKVEVAEFSGEIAIGADCTATAKTGTGADATNLDMIVVNSGNDFSAVVRAGDATLVGVGTKVEGKGTCSLATLEGAYGYQGEGVATINGKSVSTAEIGILTFDGKEGVTGAFSAIGGGQMNRQSFTGSYALNDLCFGSAVYKVGDVDYQMNFMVTGGGNQLLYSELAAGAVTTGSGARTTFK